MSLFIFVIGSDECESVQVFNLFVHICIVTGDPIRVRDFINWFNPAIFLSVPSQGAGGFFHT